MQEIKEIDTNLSNKSEVSKKNCQEKSTPPAKQYIYDKVDNKKRSELLRLLQEENNTLKEASEKLKINYSTAKTIIRVYRKENRIFKKCTKNLEEIEEEKNMDKKVTFNGAAVNSAAINSAPRSAVNSSTVSSIPENEEFSMLGKKLKRDFKMCNILLTEIYKDVLINKRILDNLVYLSSILNTNQY